MRKKKRLILIFTVLLLVTASITMIFIVNRSSDEILGRPLVAGIAKNACNREVDLTLKCFDLVGKAYVVSEKDSAKILDKLAAIVESRHLTDNKAFEPHDSKALGSSGDAAAADSNNTSTQGRTLISLTYSGGLFGQYHFPYSKDGRALYATTFTIEPKDSSDSDSTYILDSEFGTTDAQAQIILNVAKTLPKDKYILMIAEN
jgi:hypothetical protein